MPVKLPYADVIEAAESTDDARWYEDNLDTAGMDSAIYDADNAVDYAMTILSDKGLALSPDAVATLAVGILQRQQFLHPGARETAMRYQREEHRRLAYRAGRDPDTQAKIDRRMAEHEAERDRKMLRDYGATVPEAKATA